MKYSIICLFLVQSIYANIMLPSIFSDHMVLQQNSEVKLWGWASLAEDVSITPSWTKQVYKVNPDKSSNWSITIPTPSYGGPYTIEFKGYNTVTLNDIMIGEVWLCSGQSNMEMSASWGITHKEEIEKANKPLIRFFNVPRRSADTPQLDIRASWQNCTPNTMPHHSAVAYFFASKLQEYKKDVPIGLVISSWGGTPAEVWIPEDVIWSDTTLKKASEDLGINKWAPEKPGTLFNAMIHPLVGYEIAGTLWYQGESNVGSTVYDKTFSALIHSWRDAWGAKFPFYFVQIAPYNYEGDVYQGVRIRDRQRRVANQIKNTKMVVTSDVSTTDDIHPKDKKSVGHRLANIALKYHYKTLKGLVDSPEIQQYAFKKNTVKLTLAYAKGLYADDTLSLFEVAGDDQQFVKASYEIKGNIIKVSSNTIQDIKHVRFAWGNTIQSNVFNNVKLPLSSFFINKD